MDDYQIFCYNGNALENLKKGASQMKKVKKTSKEPDISLQIVLLLGKIVVQLENINER